VSRLKIVALIVLCLACLTATGSPVVFKQRRANANKVTVRAKGHRAVVVRSGGRSHRLDLSKYINAAHIEDVSVAFLTRKDGFTYLVLDVCGLSKLPPDDHECGAGVECDLVWLKLDGVWRVKEAKDALYMSCWSSISNDDAVRIEGRRLFVEYDNFRSNTRGRVTYDADNPESGLVVEEKPLHDATPTPTPTPPTKEEEFR
jgi:hypothetical protein